MPYINRLIPLSLLKQHLNKDRPGLDIARLWNLFTLEYEQELVGLQATHGSDISVSSVMLSSN